LLGCSVAGLLGGFFLALHPSYETSKRLSGLSQFSNDSRVRIIGQESETLCRNALRFDFKKRAAGLTKKLSLFTRRQAALPFRDTATRTDGSASELRRQAEHLA